MVNKYFCFFYEWICFILYFTLFMLSSGQPCCYTSYYWTILLTLANSDLAVSVIRKHTKSILCINTQRWSKTTVYWSKTGRLKINEGQCLVTSFQRKLHLWWVNLFHVQFFFSLFLSGILGRWHLNVSHKRTLCFSRNSGVRVHGASLRTSST